MSQKWLLPMREKLTSGHWYRMRRWRASPPSHYNYITTGHIEPPVIALTAIQQKILIDLYELRLPINLKIILYTFDSLDLAGEMLRSSLLIR